MPHTSESQATNGKTAVKPATVSPSEYTYKAEEVTVRYWKGQPIQVVHPPDLSCLRSTPPTPVNRGGRPSVENDVRYVLNRALSDYIFGVPKPDPVPVTRYGLATLALKWCDKEREEISKSSAPKWDKEIRLAQLTVSRDSIDNFVKRFFKKKGQRLSPKDLARIIPLLWYQ
jgi:hypothetical protein